MRHGAATGLREIIKVHGGGAGKTNDMSTSEVSKNPYTGVGEIAGYF